MLSVAAFVVLLGVLVTVHEFGHFIVAKLVGVRVLTFSLGFGPRLFGFRIGETDYRLSALPLGGYVRMYGDDVSAEVPADQAHRAFLLRGFFAKSAIAIAGPVANILLPFALFFAQALGTETVADAVIGATTAGDPADLAGLRAGDRVVRIDDTPIAVFSDVQAVVETHAGRALDITVERNGSPRTLRITPRAAPAPTLFDSHKQVGRLGVMSVQELPVVLVRPQSPAWVAGLRNQDVVSRVNGQTVDNSEQLFALLDAAADAWTLQVASGTDAPRTVSVPAVFDETLTARTSRFAVVAADLADSAVAVAATAGVGASAQALRERRRGVQPAAGLVAYVLPGTVAHAQGLVVGADRVVAVDGVALHVPGDIDNALQAAPDAVHTLAVLTDIGPHTLVFRMGPHPKRQLKSLKVWGAQVDAPYGNAKTVQRHVGVVQAGERAVGATWDAVVDVLRGFGLLASGRVGVESLGGPITIFKLAGEAAHQGAQSFLGLMVVISVNLAVLNLMPIPVLDGGHLTMFAVEAVTRKRITLQTRALAGKLGLAIIGVLMFLSFRNDILDLF